MRMMGRLSGKRQSTSTDGPQYDVRVVRTNKVFKTHKGGKTASWSILVVVGDNKGQVGAGTQVAQVIAADLRKGGKRLLADRDHSAGRGGTAQARRRPGFSRPSGTREARLVPG